MVPITSAFFGPGGMRDAAALLVQHRQTAGKPIDTWELGMQATTLVAASDEEAWSLAKHAIWQNRAGRALNRLEVTDGRVSAPPYEGEPTGADLERRLYYGSPDTVIARFREAAAQGTTLVSNWMMHGAMPHARIMESIRLMGEHVIPALKDVRPPEGLAAELLGHGTASEAMRGRPPAPSE
jgi:alkanesulfonate monooxygenase SsuD/methylene tetrahydromethanopterin reductase-like flavin-dependent oxidoreductase (luciferase family)